MGNWDCGSWRTILSISTLVWKSGSRVGKWDLDGAMVMALELALGFPIPSSPSALLIPST